MAENLSQSELDYPFKLLEYFNGFRVSKVTFSHMIQIDSLHRALISAGIYFKLICCSGSILVPQ